MVNLPLVVPASTLPALATSIEPVPAETLTVSVTSSAFTVPPLSISMVRFLPTVSTTTSFLASATFILPATPPETATLSFAVPIVRLPVFSFPSIAAIPPFTSTLFTSPTFTFPEIFAFSAEVRSPFILPMSRPPVIPAPSTLMVPVSFAFTLPLKPSMEFAIEPLLISTVPSLARAFVSTTYSPEASVIFTFCPFMDKEASTESEAFT